HSDAIELLLYAYRKKRDPDLLHMARKTLEFMSRGDVFDREWGGFFRYATRRDWSEPHYEKMLEDNAKLLSNLLTLYRTTLDAAGAEDGQQRDTREAALAALEFLWNECRDPERGMYRFHDGSGPKILGLLGDQAHTAKALLDAHEVTGDAKYLERALELARLMLGRFVDRENGGFYDVWDDVQD